jgi:hypothetical protein
MPQALAGHSQGVIYPDNLMQPQHMVNSFQQPSTFSDPQNNQMNPDMSQQQQLNASYMPQALAGQVMNPYNSMQPMQTVVNIPEELITGKEKVKTGWERLEERDGVFIEQKKEMMEILRNEKVRSDYSIYGLSVDGERRGKKIYKGRELHSGRDEFCMTKGCSFFELKINLADGDEQKTPFLYINRPSSCTCLCFGRPGLKVSYVENGKNQYLGRIKDTWGFCSLILQIFDEDNSLKYTIEAWCCQCGLNFDCPMDCCHDVGFYVRDGMGKTLATIEKKRQGCTAPKMDRKNNFAVRFPEKASKEDKALIMAAAFLLDYRYFNDN